MAAKQKHRMGLGAAELLQQAQRSLEKGDFKQALKDAKVGYRQQPGPEARQLLQRAYFARGRQLYRVGLQDESRAVIESLLELGATDDSVRQELPELLVALGLFNRVAAVGGANVSLEEGSPLYTAAADHAVLRPDKASASLPAIRQGVGTIHRALAALEKGDEAEALAALKDIARASPLADWKYFVRGLAAYYRQDAAEMGANWDRLDAGRFAARIAASLKVLADPAVVPMDGIRTTDTLARLGSAVLGGPILARLQTLQGHVAAGRWREAVKLLPAVNQSLRQIDSLLTQRLENVLYAAIVRKGKPAALRELAAVMEPLPIDPHWNRGLAIAWECFDGEDDEYVDDLAQAERHWRAYLDDLARLECLLPAERTLARALVWFRLGRMLAEESSEMCPTCGVRHDPDEDMKARAIDCFENALKLSPTLLGAYRALAEAYREWSEPEKAAATWRRLAEQFPENLDALLFLADHHIRRDEPFAAREYVFRAQRLKPLDATIKAMAGSVHLASARHHALAGDWEAGREEFAAAEKLDRLHAESSHVLVRRAALELKAGDMGLANRLLDRAKNALGEAAPIWLLMTIESRRYALLRVVADEFEHRWLSGLKKSRRSTAIGEMCRTMTAHLTMNVDYSGRDEHVTKLVDFLRGCRRLRKWQARDLRSALDFLIVCEHAEKRRQESFPKKRNASNITKLWADLASRARRKFPDIAFFQLAVGELEMRKGPSKCNRSLARECFQRALQLAQGAGDPDGMQTVKRARENLDLLGDADGLSFGDEFRSLPSLVDRDDDDDDDEAPFGPFGFDEGEQDGRVPGRMPTDLPKGLFAEFMAVCRAMGLDPEAVFKRTAADKSFQFRTQDAPSPKRKKRK